MTRTEIVNNKSYWQRQYNSYSEDLRQAQEDVGKLQTLSGKLSEQYDLFDGYLNKRRRKLSQFSFLAGKGRIADGYLNGMTWDVNSSQATGILSNVSGSISHISGEIGKLNSTISDLRGKMNTANGNINYWDQKLREYDAAAAAAQSSGTTAQ